MTFIIIMNCIMLILVASKVKLCKMPKKILIMYILWTSIILTISTFNLYGLLNVSDKVYILWIINIDILVLTIIMFANKQEKQEKINFTSRLESSKILLFSQIVLSVILMYYEIRYKNLIANMPLEYIRMARFDSLFYSGIENIFFEYIVAGTLRVHLMIIAILIIEKKFKNKICLLGIVDLILYTMIGYGRMIIFEFVLYLIIAYLIVNYDKKHIINIKKLILVCIIGIILILIGASIVVIRLKGSQYLNVNTIYEYGIDEQIKQIIVYFTGGFRALDKFVLEGFESINGLTLGRLMVAGLEDIIGLVLNNIGINYTTINSLVGPITQSNIMIGEKIYFNAFYTCVMNYFGDFGYIGVIIGPILNGILISYSINKYIKKRDLQSYLLLTYVIMNAFCSIYRWNYQFGQYMFLLIVLILVNNFKLEKGNKKNDKENNKIYE